MEDASLFPIALLIDELKHDQIELRLNAIRRIGTIALALGHRRTRDELIPFILDCIDDEDEVLVAIADELGSFVDYVGGPSFAHLILSPLETLAAVEETTVRDHAVASLNLIVVHLDLNQLDSYYIPMLKRLASGDWFTSRASACHLFDVLYPLIEAEQSNLVTLFTSLVNDDTPMVRRASAASLTKLALKLQKQVIIDYTLPLFKILSQDDQDSVRLLTVDVMISISSVLGQNDSKTHLLEACRALCNDKSWRVRYMVADKFNQIAKSFGSDIINEELANTFINILKDNEAEVRTAAATQIPGFCALVDKSVVLNLLLPCVKLLVGDGSTHVRASLATEISCLAPYLGRDVTIEQLLPQFLLLLKDETSEVRLNIISKLDKVNEIIGIELLSQSLLPAIVELAEDKQWRVRLAIIENIPLLASQLGKDFFNDKLGVLCISWLGDPVFSIREAAAKNLRRLAEVFGSEWTRVAIIPKIVGMGTNQNYLFRMTTIHAMTTLAQVANLQLITESIVPTMLSLSSDPIPNIRFNVAKGFETIIPLLKKLGTDNLKDVIGRLTAMKSDADVDVRFFSERALSVA